jgi:DNA-binding response OmpR family regulator
VKILIVDDENDITSSIKTGLTKNGFDVDAYTDPQKALDDFKPNVYDLSIIDVRMPKMSGFELCREIKKKDDDAKICFMTAFEIYYDEFNKVFPTINVQCFIRKPISLADLISHIRTELNMPLL